MNWEEKCTKQIAEKDRKELETKLANVFDEEINSLSTELREILLDDMVTEATLCEIIHGGRILLQRKSAGRFGEGKWNGPGGKVQPGETPLKCVVREVRAETGL